MHPARGPGRVIASPPATAWWSSIARVSPTGTSSVTRRIASTAFRCPSMNTAVDPRDARRRRGDRAGTSRMR